MVFAIASLVGVSLRIDSATAFLKRPSMARVQVELDLLKDRPNKLWIDTDGEEGFWQKVDYENVPEYCQHCWHIGHAEEHCHIHHPELKALPKKPNLPTGGQPRQVYVPVMKQPEPISIPSTLDRVHTTQPLQHGNDLAGISANTQQEGNQTPPDVSTASPQENIVHHHQDAPASPQLFPEFHVEQDIFHGWNENMPRAGHFAPALNGPSTAGDLLISSKQQNIIGQPVQRTDVDPLDLHSYSASHAHRLDPNGRSTLLQEFKDFSTSLQCRILHPNAIDPTQPSADADAADQQRKRGRPKKTLFQPLGLAPSHPMITRSSSSSSHTILND